MNRSDLIFGKLKGQLDAVNAHYNCVFLALVGSQNYCLDDENSDVDSKAIVVPTFDEIARGDAPVSTTLDMDDGGKVDVKDIRVMMNCYRKQGVNFLETLYTPWTLTCTNYADLFERLRKHRDAIARYHQAAAVESACGMIVQKCKAMEKRRAGNATQFAACGYDPKQLLHALRMLDFLSKYAAGQLFEICLIPDDTAFLMEVKRGTLPLDDARILAESCMSIAKEIRDLFVQAHRGVIDKGVDELLTDIARQTLRRAMDIESCTTRNKLERSV